MADLAIDAKQVFYRMLRDENGSTDIAAADGSVTPVKFRCGLGEGNTLALVRVNFVLQATNFQEDGWFEDNNPLTNGLEFRIVEGDTGQVVASFNQEFKIKRNIDWGIITGSDIFFTGAFSGTKESALFRWEVERAGARVLVRPSQCFELLVSDDLTGANRIFRTMVQGFTVKAN